MLKAEEMGKVLKPSQIIIMKQSAQKIRHLIATDSAMISIGWY